MGLVLTTRLTALRFHVLEFSYAIPSKNAASQKPGTESSHLIELAPSILSADFARLGEQVRAAGEGGGSVIHVDIMDGHFVPNLTIGPPVVKSLRKATKLPLDCHLMIENPGRVHSRVRRRGGGLDFGASGSVPASEPDAASDQEPRLPGWSGDQSGDAGGNALSEVLDIVDYVLVMSVNPGFGAQKFIPSTLHKMRRLAEIRSQRGLHYRIEVDGGVALDTVADVVRAGAEILVAGNAVFGNGDPSKNAQELLKAATEAAMQKV